MFLLGHLGIGLGLAWLLSWKSPTRIDYRWVLFGAILPELIDKPLGFLTGLDSRLWAHTFLSLLPSLPPVFVPSPRGFPSSGSASAPPLPPARLGNSRRSVLSPPTGGTSPPAPSN